MPRPAWPAMRVNHIANIFRRFSQVNADVAEGAGLSGQIAHNIHEVDLAASESSNCSTQVDNHAATLSELAQQLNILLAKFRAAPRC